MADKVDDYIKLTRKTKSRKFETPEDMLKAAEGYFRWCIDNPIIKKEVVKYKDTHEIVELEAPRPFTLYGLCNHLGLSDRYFTNFKKNNKEADRFEEAIKRIKMVVSQQKLEHAIVGNFNATITARLEGLYDGLKVGAPNPDDDAEPVTITVDLSRG